MVPFDLLASDKCFTQKDHISRVFGKDAAKAAPKIDVIEPMLTTFPPIASPRAQKRRSKDWWRARYSIRRACSPAVV